MKNGDGTKRFPRLSAIAKLVLTLSHSNAEEERLFSMVKRNKTSFRPNLQESLGSILTVKLAMKNKRPHSLEIHEEILSKAKKATLNYNKKH